MVKKEWNSEELFLKQLRVNLQDKYTEGALFIETGDNHDKYLYDILEDKVRDINADGDLQDQDEGKVYAETAIPYTPEGYCYELEVTYSPKFEMEMVLVKDVPEFTGIRMHWGLSALQSAGCILGGKRIAPNRLKNIGYTKAMVELLKKHGGKAYLKIV